MDFLEEANGHHPTIKFTAEVYDTEMCLDTKVYKAERFAQQSRLDIKTHWVSKLLKDFSHAFLELPPTGGYKRASSRVAFRFLQTNSSETAFKTAISQFKTNVIDRGYPETLVSTTLAEIPFEERKPALQQIRRQDTWILHFVTQYRPSLPNLKQILMQNWHLIQLQPLLRRIFKDPPMVSYKRGRSLRDILFRAKR